MSGSKCPRCGGEMIQKSRAKLFAVGVASWTCLPLATLHPALKPPVIGVLFLGIYFFMWATAGKGLWCRNCKRF